MMDTRSTLKPHKKKLIQWGIPLLVSSLVGIACCDQIAKFYDQKGPQYLVAQRDLMAGQRLSVLDFELSSTCSKKVICISDQQLESVLNQTLQISLPRGAPLTPRHLKRNQLKLSRYLKRGYLAYSICSDTVVPLQVGDHVDVFTLSQGETLPVVQSVRLLGVGTCEAGRSLVLALRPRSIARLEKARQQGKLKVALRNPRDSTRRPRRKLRRRRKRKSVVIISG